MRGVEKMKVEADGHLTSINRQMMEFQQLFRNEVRLSKICWRLDALQRYQALTLVSASEVEHGLVA